MQIEIYNPVQGQPLPPVEWNFTEVKQWVQDGLEAYKGRVYTDDTIAQAKKDRATLNKLAEAIDTKRKEMKAKYLEPYEQFDRDTKELKAMIKDQVAEIDAQVKASEKFKKDEKLERIKIELYGPMIGKLAELVPYERLHDPKWLNVSASMSTISTALGEKIDRIISGLETIDKLDYGEITSNYRMSHVVLDITDAEGKVVQTSTCFVREADKYSFQMKSFRVDAVSEVINGRLDLDALPAGTYTCTITCHVSTGDELVANQFEFTK